MKQFWKEPVIGLNTTVFLALLSSTGAVFLWVLRSLYSNPHSLQFTHALSPDTQKNAPFNLAVASVFYLVLFMFCCFELVLHLRNAHKPGWDASIAMVDLHQPKDSGSVSKRPPLSASKSPSNDSSARLSGHESRPDLRLGSGGASVQASGDFSGTNAANIHAVKRRSLDHGPSSHATSPR